jgi:PAS domain S-box-containing protein
LVSFMTQPEQLTANQKAETAKREAQIAEQQADQAQKDAKAALDKVESARRAAKGARQSKQSTQEDKNSIGKAEIALKEATEALHMGERARKEAQASRETAELARTEAEGAREKAEQARSLSEEVRTRAEASRSQSELERIKAEEAKKLIGESLAKAESSRKEAEQALGAALEAKDIASKALSKAEQAEERYQLVIQASNDGIWDWNILANELYWNGRFFEMLGFSKKELSPTEADLWEAVHPEDKSRLEESFQAALKCNQKFEHYFRIQNKAGQYVDCCARGQTLFNNQGKPVRMAGMITDITKRKEAERKLSEYQSKLEQSNQDLDQFASIAAHDLQAPLRKIRIFSEQLEKDISTPQTLDDLRRMQRSVIDMQSLVADLLAYSRVSHGNSISNLKAVNLNELLNKVQEELKDQLNSKQAHLDIGSLGSVKGDANLLQQLFQNLFENALKFQSSDQRPHITVSSKPTEKGFCQIQVKDNGIGFDESQAERIFGMFERLHGKSAYPGTGIGLAICRRIAERHGGSITAESKPGEGSNFIVSLMTA